MKRVLAAILIIFLLSITCSAFAESDFSGYSTEELYNLRNAINLELYKRENDVGSTTMLPEGKYLVGEDIAPGEYIFTCIALTSRETYFTDHASQTSAVITFKQNGKMIEQYSASAVGAMCRFTVPEGITIELRFGIWDVQKAPAFAFAP